jgi:hypothetical protein
MKKLLVLLFSILLLSSPSVFAEDISGTGWVIDHGKEKVIVLFERDKTFTYLNYITSVSDEGKVNSDSSDTWTINGDKVVMSYTNGYRICSLTLNKSKDKMIGTCVNKKGTVQQSKGQLIE